MWAPAPPFRAVDAWKGPTAPLPPPKQAPSAVPFAGVGKPFLKHAERQAEGLPREALCDFEARAVLALPRGGESLDGERPWFSGQIVATDGSRRQFQLVATPLPPCEDGCKCSGGDGAHRYRLQLKDTARNLGAVVICDASGGDFLRLAPADPAMLAFEPGTLLEDAKARRALDTFFPRLAAQAEACDVSGEAFSCCVVTGRFACKQLLLFGPR